MDHINTVLFSVSSRIRKSFLLTTQLSHQRLKHLTLSAIFVLPQILHFLATVVVLGKGIRPASHLAFPRRYLERRRVRHVEAVIIAVRVAAQRDEVMVPSPYPRHLYQRGKGWLVISSSTSTEFNEIFCFIHDYSGHHLYVLETHTLHTTIDYIIVPDVIFEPINRKLNILICLK